MAVTLRAASMADRSRCIELLAELGAATGNPHSGKVDDTFAALLTAGRGRILLAVEDNVILGMASVSYNLALRYGGEYCQLEELIVTPQARGKKVGALLVEGFIDDARQRGCAEIGLYLVASTEHNREFYERFGFVPVGTEMRMSLA